jgi:hypothetical protein
LGFICFPVDLTHLQVQKPASADLHNIKFIKDWGEINPEFFPDSLTQARGPDTPQARISAHLSTHLRAHLRICPYKDTRIRLKICIVSFLMLGNSLPCLR